MNRLRPTGGFSARRLGACASRWAARLVVSAVIAGVTIGIASARTAPGTAPTAAPATGRAAWHPVGSLARSARVGWSVVGLGDSVTSGYHCDCTPFVQQYADLAAASSGRAVTSDNLGVPGLTTGGLLDQLSGVSNAAQAVAGADIVLVTIGANDVAPAMADWSDGNCDENCLLDQAAQVEAGTRAVLDRIRDLRGDQPTEILVTTYWNVVQDGAVARDAYPAAYLQASDTLTRAVNASICAAAAADTAVCVDLYAPFKGDGGQDPTPLLASDGDHPDAAGHALIARTLAAAGWQAIGGPA